MCVAPRWWWRLIKGEDYMSDTVLTAKQIKDMDEFLRDKRVIEETLNVALTYHSNRMNEIVKIEKDWWAELKEIHDLDDSKRWTIDSSGPFVEIVEKED